MKWVQGVGSVGDNKNLDINGQNPHKVLSVNSMPRSFCLGI